MESKRIVTGFLLTFLVASLAYFLFKEFRPAGESGSPAAETAGLDGSQPSGEIGDPEPENADRIIAYYFHATRRCITCRKLESYTMEAVTIGFSDDMESGRLEWRTVNVEEPGNYHFVEDYRLSTKSVVIVDMRDGKQARWKNLKRIWELVNDKTVFIDYIQYEVGAYLEDVL